MTFPVNTTKCELSCCQLAKSSRTPAAKASNLLDMQACQVPKWNYDWKLKNAYVCAAKTSKSPTQWFQNQSTPAHVKIKTTYLRQILQNLKRHFSKMLVYLCSFSFSLRLPFSFSLSFLLTCPFLFLLLFSFPFPFTFPFSFSFSLPFSLFLLFCLSHFSFPLSLFLLFCTFSLFLFDFSFPFFFLFSFSLSFSLSLSFSFKRQVTGAKSKKQ